MYIAVMGYGTVGSGVVEVFTKNHESIVKRSTQKELELKYILDIRDFPDDPNRDKFVKDFNIILNDSEVGIVVETMGGLHPAYEFVSQLLAAGKSVVTSNKELVATKGYELLCIAEEHNCNFLFEASVGGGIPIIRPIVQCLAANQIDEIAGILNGTTNFILTRMIEDNMDFDEALKLAQENGYAERDPSADIDGVDACRKISILASLCFGRHVYPDVVHTEGIRNISLDDVDFVRNYGGVIKLIGSARREINYKIAIEVRPCVVMHHSQLATVDDVFNAILVRGDAIGDVIFYGRGAGKLPTASAVVADVIDCAKHTAKKKLIGWDESKPDYVVDYQTLSTSLYIRAYTDDKDIIKKIENAVGEVETISRDNQPENEIAFVTGVDEEKTILNNLAKISSLDIKSVIRVTDY